MLSSSLNTDCIALSIGAGASSSGMKSPRKLSSSSPTGASSETGSCAASVGSLVTYYLFVTGAQDPELSVGPTMLYMPAIILTVLALAIAMLINIPKWAEKQAIKAREKAPSILSDEDDDN